MHGQQNVKTHSCFLLPTRASFDPPEYVFTLSCLSKGCQFIYY